MYVYIYIYYINRLHYSSNAETTSFTAPSIAPSFIKIPIPGLDLLIASMAYSTYNSLPF